MKLNFFEAVGIIGALNVDVKLIASLRTHKMFHNLLTLFGKWDRDNPVV